MLFATIGSTTFKNVGVKISLDANRNLKIVDFSQPWMMYERAKRGFVYSLNCNALFPSVTPVAPTSTYIAGQVDQQSNSSGMLG